jgi:hypothetical protein
LNLIKIKIRVLLDPLKIFKSSVKDHAAPYESPNETIIELFFND